MCRQWIMIWCTASMSSFKFDQILGWPAGWEAGRYSWILGEWDLAVTRSNGIKHIRQGQLLFQARGDFDIKGSDTDPARSLCADRTWDLEWELGAHRATQHWTEELGSKAPAV